MSRPRANQEEAAKEAFVKEVKVRRICADMKQRELAVEVGVAPSVMSTLLSNPDKISAGRLRRIVQAVGPDPLVVLTFLGYTPKEIRKLQGDYDPVKP